jgi:hypothetical protein
MRAVPFYAAKPAGRFDEQDAFISHPSGYGKLTFQTTRQLNLLPRSLIRLQDPRPASARPAVTT